MGRGAGQRGAAHRFQGEPDGADVLRADSREREEAKRPLASQYDALVGRQHGGEAAQEGGRHGEQGPGEVVAAPELPVGGRVHAVVVAGRQVEYAVEQAAVGVLGLRAEAQEVREAE